MSTRGVPNPPTPAVVGLVLSKGTPSFSLFSMKEKRDLPSQRWVQPTTIHSADFLERELGIVANNSTPSPAPLPSSSAPRRHPPAARGPGLHSPQSAAGSPPCPLGSCPLSGSVPCGLLSLPGLVSKASPPLVLLPCPQAQLRAASLCFLLCRSPLLSLTFAPARPKSEREGERERQSLLLQQQSCNKASNSNFRDRTSAATTCAAGLW